MKVLENLDFKLIGASHDPFITLVVENLPKGLKIDEELIDLELSKRRPDGVISTNRIEKDRYEFVTGVKDLKTTGETLKIVVYNDNIIKKDYTVDFGIIRPGHADYTSFLKNKDNLNITGGGKFSGRLTAPLVIFGAICKRYLMDQGIYIGSLIRKVGSISDHIPYIGSLSVEKIKELNETNFPCISPALKEEMEEEIMFQKSIGDSIGSKVTTFVSGIKKPLGDAYFQGVESLLSYLIYGIPAVKAVSFGLGEGFSDKVGSEVSDAIYYNNDDVEFRYNFNGGILGGITNTANLVVNTTFKPTPSIEVPQNTIDVVNKKNVIHTFKGRHDPCIGIRGYVVVESMIAVGLMDLLMGEENE